MLQLKHVFAFGYVRLPLMLKLQLLFTYLLLLLIDNLGLRFYFSLEAYFGQNELLGLQFLPLQVIFL